MRVIGGRAKGRKLAAVPGDATRPILDRVKTALFDMLRPGLPGCRVLDLFAGTGGVGIEALSQGAGRCVFCDLSRDAVRTIEANLETAGLADQAEVIKTDALEFIERCPGRFDLIYVAPPQYQGLWLKALELIDARPELLAPDGVVIVQIFPKEWRDVALAHLVQTDRRQYGSTALHFFAVHTDLRRFVET